MRRESTHIRIDADLKQYLQGKARTGESVNDVIRRLVLDDLKVDQDNDTTPAPVNSDVNEKLTDLYQRVVVLETGSKMDSDYIDVIDERVQNLETRTRYLLEIAKKLHPLIEESQSDVLPELPESYMHVNMKPARGEGEEQNNEISKPDTVRVNRNVNTLKMTENEEWIYVTDKIRDQMIARVVDLQKSGMSYEKIGKLIGMSKGRLSEMHHRKMKKIHRTQYEALMNIP
jgi:hypothetical protein